LTKPDVRARLAPAMAQALDAQAAHAKRLGLVAAPSPTDDPAAARDAYHRLRAFWQSDGPALPAVEDRTVPAAHGDIPVRVYRPSDDAGLPVVVYAHGGGWYLGSLDSHDRLTRRLAHESGAAVVAVDYRLAPEHPHPAQIEDVRAVLAWLRADGASAGLDGTRIALAGDSAGAHIMLAAAQAERDAGAAALRALALFYGYFGLRDGAAMRLWGGPEDGLGADDFAAMLALAVPDPARRAAPDFDLLSAPLDTLPPCRIIAAELDPLADDSRALAALIEAAGGDAELSVAEGVLHAFMMMDRMVPQGAQAIEEAAAFLARRLR
jgi:acetyl esterase